MEEYLAQWEEIYSSGLMIAGMFVLLASFLGTHKLIRQLPRGNVRRNWSVLRILIIVLTAAYASYAAASWKMGLTDSTYGTGFFMVPLTYFICACIIYLVISFALDSAVYVKKYSTGELENITDPLLGIHNRSYLDHRLSQEVKRAVRYKLPLSILLLNIDYFNSIAEQYGQKTAGDILAHYGKLLLNTARATDIVARFSEEKVMIIATNTPVTSTPVYADRLRKAVTESILLPKEVVEEFTKGKKILQVTIGIGVAGLGQDVSTVEALVKSAEDALGQAQAKGANMVIVNSSYG